MILERVESSSGEGEENLRLVRGIDISIYIDPAALQALELMVRESVNAIRGRGVEMGGLVLGRPIDWTSRKLVITGFTPVEIEYRFGPLFRISPADLETFKQSVANSKGMAIGCFRTQVRTGMLIRDDDLKLIDSLFSDRDSCFAPIEAAVNSPSLLNLHRVALKEAPQLIARFPIKQPRDGVTQPELAAAVPGPVVVSREQSIVTDESPLLARSDAAASEASVGVQARRAYRWAIPLAAAVVAIGGAAFFLGKQYGSQPKAAPVRITQSALTAPDVPLDLRIAANESAAEVLWNPNNSGAASAVRGLLVLFDGSEPKRIELDATQVRLGLYSFQARNAKISAWLTLYQASGSFAGDAKEVILPGSSATPPLASPPDRDRTRAPSQPKSSSAPVLSPQRFPKEDPTPTPPDAQSWLDPRPISPPPEPSRAPDLPKSPSVNPLSALGIQPPSVSVPDPQKPGLQYKGSVAGAMPARLLRQVTPAVPSDVAARLRTEVQLDVSVSIDPTGKVVGAQVVSSRGALASLLAIEVLKAAHFSQFAPAQIDGRPAAGNAVLSFRFAPKSR